MSMSYTLQEEKVEARVCSKMRADSLPTRARGCSFFANKDKTGLLSGYAIQYRTESGKGCAYSFVSLQEALRSCAYCERLSRKQRD